MSVHFFNFGSEEAYCMFSWLTTERKADLDSLIVKGFELAESDPMFELGKEPSLCARDALADYLCDEYLPREFESCNLFVEFGCNLKDGIDGLTSITERLLVLASNRISFTAVAEAILRHQGKWAPDGERPELI